MARQATVAPRRSNGSARSSDSSGEDIARVAYTLFEQRGRRHGFDQQDWFEAEWIVRQRTRSRRG